MGSEEKNSDIINEDIIGLDTNILVDLVCSKNFQEEIKSQVSLNAMKIYTTKLALGEAKQVLIRKKGFAPKKATAELKKILKKFSIKKITHNKKSDRVGEEWVDKIKEKMYIEKFSSFPNDCKILANLYDQTNMNIYFTEDKQIEKVVKILGLDINIKIIPEASNLSNAKIKKFFKEMRKDHHK